MGDLYKKLGIGFWFYFLEKKLLVNLKVSCDISEIGTKQVSATYWISFQPAINSDPLERHFVYYCPCREVTIFSLFFAIYTPFILYFLWVLFYNYTVKFHGRESIIAAVVLVKVLAWKRGQLPLLRPGQTGHSQRNQR